MPVVGALIIGLMARYGSERIRGHGIPEAIEAILINGSKVEPKVAHSQAALERDFDRLGRAVRRRRADHYDRRGDRIDDRAAFPAHQHRAQDAAGGRSGGGHVGHLRRARCGGAAGGGTAALRVETAQLDSGGAGQRDGRRGAALPSGVGPLFPGAAASRLHRPAGSTWLRGGGGSGGRALRAADGRRLCRGRRFSAGCPSTGCGGLRWGVLPSGWAA